jgi:flagellar transcriptional activator FlhD
MENDTLRLIQEMNFSYLLLIQRLLTEDKAMGMTCLGVSSEMADILAALTLKEVARLAAVPQILCSFRFRDNTVLAALTHGQIEVPATPHPLRSKSAG